MSSNIKVISAKIVVEEGFPKIVGCADDDSVRFALGGVAMYPAQKGRLLLAASDGRKLGTVLIEGECQLGEGHKMAVIPACVFPANDSESKDGIITCENDKWRFEAKKHGRKGTQVVVREGDTMEGRFPDIGSIFPDTNQTTAEVCLNPEFLVQLAAGMRGPANDNKGVVLHIPVKDPEYFELLVDSKDVRHEVKNCWELLKDKGALYWSREVTDEMPNHGPEKMTIFRMAFDLKDDSLGFVGGFFVDQNAADASVLNKWPHHADVSVTDFVAELVDWEQSTEESQQSKAFEVIDHWACAVAKKINRRILAGAFDPNQPVGVTIGERNVHSGLVMPLHWEPNPEQAARHIKTIREIVGGNSSVELESDPGEKVSEEAEPEPEVEVEAEVAVEPEPEEAVEPKPEPEEASEEPETTEPAPNLQELLRIMRQNQALIDSLKEKVASA